MKQVELLSPAGSFERGVAAIQNGCDALYLAGNRFGARAYASNFDEKQLQEMVQYAHAYGVKVYITLNTLIHDEELESCFTYIDFLYSIKVDAVIVQDLGIMSYIRMKYPDFEVHASTQMHIVNENALHFLMDMGIPRAVLAREVRVDEIKKFSSLPIELEVFVHGALCVSYSGQCLISSMVGGRSGNRGECAQSCRMPYSLVQYESGKMMKETCYLLSLKDLNSLSHVRELMESGIDSFKIEGRMKKSEYVGYITSLYRKAMDDPKYHVSEKEIEQAKKIFNRGYTDGFLYNKRGSSLYNPIRPNHLGVQIGKVIAVRKGRITVALEKELHQGDGVRILMDDEDFGFMVNKMYLHGLLVNHANAKDVVEIECKGKIVKGSLMVKTSDVLLEKEIAKTFDKIQRRVKVDAIVKAAAGKTLQMKFMDGVHTVEVEAGMLEPAKTRATTKEEIATQVQKTQSTIFMIDHLAIEMEEELFIPVKLLNQLRRDGLEKLYTLRSEMIGRTERKLVLPVSTSEKTACVLDAKVQTQEQVDICIQAGIANIYIEDESLYQANQSYSQVQLVCSRVPKGEYQGKVIQDVGGIYACDEFIADASLNVYNAYTCHLLHCLGAETVTLSHELDRFDVETLMENYRNTYKQNPNTAKCVYGRVEVMVSEHCPINASLLDNDKKNCALCRKCTYALKDKFGNLYPMRNDESCRMRLYDYKIKDEINDIAFYQKIGVSHLRLDFTFENAEETRRIIEKSKKAME